MKIALSWLREWVDLPTDSAVLAQALTMAGFEVEAQQAATVPFVGVVVAEVVSVEAHPEADKLRVCQVSIGGAERFTVVCGARNVRVGLKTPLATLGALLPGDVRISRAKLRGIESEGMLCSARELGLGDVPEGLLELPAESELGTDLRVALALDDTVFDINFTPNRGDALSVLGLAREVAVITGQALKMPEIDALPVTITDHVGVRVSCPSACATFAGRVIRGVNPKAQTPLWMRERLRRAGLRSLGPLVDVTNYVMLELGQPMHAYDLRQITDHIEVRMATPGESLRLLEGSEIALSDDMVVIADASAPLGLAGVMGGAKSGIAVDTTDVFLESAWFAPHAIAGRGRRFGILTDASSRFERGVDPTGAVRAMERATQLLVAMAGGQVGPLQVEHSAAHQPTPLAIELRPSYIRRLIGIDIESARVGRILTALGMRVDATATGWAVTPPAWRFDIAQEADLVEEVARIFGYNEIPEIDANLPQRPGHVPEGVIEGSRFSQRLVDLGFYEAINFTFVDPLWQRQLFPDARPLSVVNPISAELADMRVSLWPGLLKNLAENVRRQQSRVKLFEVGSRFIQQDTELKEINTISGLTWGAVWPEQWAVTPRTVDFYDLKAEVEALLCAAGETSDRFVAETLSCLHPGRSARIYREKQAIGWIGELHPEWVRLLDLNAAPVLFELDAQAISQALVPHAEELSRFPSVRRDLAVVVDEGCTFNELRESVTVTASSLLRDLTAFDVYRGKGVEIGRKSVALALIFQDKNRTLAEGDVEAVMRTIRARLQNDLRATFRD